MTKGAEAFKYLTWRAHTPRWSFAPTSGVGASRRGGRFNRPGIEALYITKEQETAADEFLQGLIRPYIMVPYQVSFKKIADLTNPRFLKLHKIKPGDLTIPWKFIARIEGRDPITWRIADDLIKKGFEGALYPSQALSSGTNLVVWNWNEKTVIVQDSYRDLPRNQKSWDD